LTMKKRVDLFFLLSALALVSFSGCASITTLEEGVIQPHEPLKKGVYHKVKRGETLWRIAKTYDISISDIIETNSIPNVAQIEKNQLVFIPGADAIKEVPLEIDARQNDFIWPLKGDILRYFHQRIGLQINKGIDIQSQEGTEVKATRTGQVVFADFLNGYGYTIIIDHADEYYSVYTQNAKLLTSLGDLVFKGTPIALVGRNPNDSGYLHFEIRKNLKEDNPLYYLP